MARRSKRPLLGGIVLGAVTCAGIGVLAAAQRADNQTERARAAAQAPAAAQAAPLQQTALSLPRPPAPGNGGAAVNGLPTVLHPSEASRLRRAFELQAAGDFAAAARETERLEDKRLFGQVLAHRWLQPGAQPTAADLQAWLARHGDHPDAPRLHALLVRLLPRGADLPPAPVQPEALSPDLSLAPEERDPPSAAPVARNPSLDRTVRERAQAGNAESALALVERTRGMTPAYAAALRADVALVLFRRGEDAKALRIAAEGAAGGSPRAAYATGLAAWGLDRPDIALPFFERAARAEAAPPALRSAAAFWTARAAVRARRPELYTPWMMQAAQESRTFYGLVARRSLGLPANFAWEGELAGDADMAPVAETAGGWRALALLQVGQHARAEAELRQLWSQARNHPGLVRAMLGVATVAGLNGLSSQLAAASQSADGRPRDFARYPLPRLQPQGGFRVDPALLYAIALQESRFDAEAVSPAGARGMMQIMPATASHITGDPSWREPAAAKRLNDPRLSLDLGQRYVHHLARLDAVEGNLIRVLAAYNAGPGNLQKWLPAHGHRDDPFLFIEAIPLDETRNYVQQVLAYSWIYASRLGLPSRSLDQIAAGEFPRFAGSDEVTSMLRRGRGRPR
ncbi:lytic transglycosylase domain-containing protein [Craurococcus roseus]|uniref:Lytic transglycosylase domain-containing protein n=2 Tax=Craurococcus roseus TaxID=77585 RepID=A0ABP3R776_9PROT